MRRILSEYAWICKGLGGFFVEDFGEFLGKKNKIKKNSCKKNFFVLLF